MFQVDLFFIHLNLADVKWQNRRRFIWSSNPCHFINDILRPRERKGTQSYRLLMLECILKATWSILTFGPRTSPVTWSWDPFSLALIFLWIVNSFVSETPIPLWVYSDCLKMTFHITNFTCIFCPLEQNRFKGPCIPNYRTYHTIHYWYVYISCPAPTPQAISSLKTQLCLICLYTIALGQFLLPTPCQHTVPSPTASPPLSLDRKHLSFSNIRW